MDNKCILQKVCRSITQFVTFRAKKRVTKRGFIKVLNRRATEFDTQAKNWQGPPRGVREKFYSRRDVFSCILKLQTMTFNNQKKITFLDNLIMICNQYPPHKLDFLVLFNSSAHNNLYSKSQSASEP